MGKCCIARRSKVIRPWKFVHSGSVGLRDSHSVVMRARINDDEFIHGIPEAFDGFFQMHGIIAHNIASTDANIISDFSSISLHICPFSLLPVLCLYFIPQMCIDLSETRCHTRSHHGVKEARIVSFGKAMIKFI